MRCTRTVTFLALLGLGLAACGDDDGGTNNTNLTNNTNNMNNSNGTADAAVQSDAATQNDAAAQGDAAVQSDAAAQSDAAVQGDAAAPTCTRDPQIASDPDPGEVACDTDTCLVASAEVCCVSMSGMECTPAADCSGFTVSPGACDGPEDCTAGQHCCVGFPGGAACGADACGGSDQELCNCDEDCGGGGKTCMACSAPGAGLIYGICAAGTCPSPYSAP